MSATIFRNPGIFSKSQISKRPIVMSSTSTDNSSSSVVPSSVVTRDSPPALAHAQTQSQAGSELQQSPIDIISDLTPISAPPSASLSLSNSLGRSSQSKSIVELEEEANQLILSAAIRAHTRPPLPTRPKQLSHSSSSKMSLSSLMPSLSNLSLSRTSTIEDNSRGRQREKDKDKHGGSRSASASASAMRSLSPFSRRRSKTRDRSPSVEALRRGDQSDIDSDTESVRPSIRTPRNAFSGGDSPSDSDEEEDDQSDHFDELTEGNTEKNAAIAPFDTNPDEMVDHEPDPLGEGVNVIRPDEPLFQPHPSIGHGPNPRRKRTLKDNLLPLKTASPLFQKDRCTVEITHGEPSAYCQNRSVRKYMVASDLSEEAKYAVEWGIGTVLKDGDEMTIVTVAETDAKLDSTGTQADRLAKLRNQQERQTLAYLLVKQATALLQRTKLNVTIKCQAVHAKNARHTLLDLVDINQPIMLIVGSRGIGKLKGILLGSTSHYLIQKSSVPVMVARRRLKRAVRHSTLAPHTKRVSLAEANIEKAGTGSAEKNVQQIRDEIAQEEASRKTVGIASTLSPMSPITPSMETGVSAANGSDSEESDDEEGVKVPG